MGNSRIIEEVFSNHHQWDLIIGSPEPQTCNPLHWLSSVFGIQFLSWTCPLMNYDKDLKWESIGTITIKALVRTLDYLQWNSIDIVAIDDGWWLNFAYLLQNEFENIKRLLILPNNMSETEIEDKIESFSKNGKKITIFCGSRNEQSVYVLDTLQFFHRRSFLIVFDLFLRNSWSSKATVSLNVVNDDDYRADFNQKFLLVFSNIFYDNNQSTKTIMDEIRKSLNDYFQNFELFGEQANNNQDEKVQFSLLSNEIMPEENDEVYNLTSFLHIEITRNTTLYGDNETFFLVRNENCIRKLQQNYAEIRENCDNCWKRNSNLIFIIGVPSLLALFFLVILVVVVCFFRKTFYHDKSNKGPYKIMLTMSEFEFPHKPVNGNIKRLDEGIEAMLTVWLQQLQEFAGPDVNKPDILKAPVSHTPKVRYNGDIVHLKLLPNNCTDLKSKSLDLLICLSALRHENINPFIGFLSNPPGSALVFDYASRGSLVDVLIMDEIKLDWSFRLSLLTDLVRGMRYLHASPVKCHGALSSRNCVIDARWVLKITDYGIRAFYDLQGLVPVEKTAKQLLWTAPEILRQPSIGGTQSGDVYSFAIIMQEVVVRGEPYCMVGLSPEEIIEKVQKPPPLIRPSVSKGAAPPEAINIMRQCWAEHPDMRPDFNTIFEQFKKLNHGRKINFVDTMFQLLEKYSNNLEELIRERTEQLDFEKKKTDKLLNRMLPSSVAEKLKLGMPVDPEEYQAVTIYFSDIVGFTEISAKSTPFQVVDLLNDLYTRFDATINAYNVYKIETIGDAYMVVAGVPSRITDHAEQIATMALDLLHQSGRFRVKHLPNTPLQLRIGLHSGPCCAGVVGLTMPRYCLFGDTVNTASRMESTGLPWRIHLSEATKNLLENAGGYSLQSRGVIDVKGKGLMHTFWLLGKDGFDKELPSPSTIQFTIVINDELDAENTKFTEVDNVASSNKIVVSESKESLKTVPTPPFLTETYSKQKNSASTNVSMEDLSIPDESNLRSICWKLLLNYLPTQRSNWDSFLSQKRNLYIALIDELIVEPGLNNKNGSNDHPLSNNPESEWQSFFKENEILLQIDKDVRRLCPDIGFFQQPTEFSPLRNFKNKEFKRLHTRVSHTILKSENVERKGLGITKIMRSKGKINEDYRPFSDNVEAHWEVVERILFLYAKLNPGQGYVQGMNEIIGPIYFLFASDRDVSCRENAEADSFFCFTNLMSEIRDFFIKDLDGTLSGINRMMAKLMSQIKVLEPEIREKLQSLQLYPQYFSFRWITLLLSQEFDLPDVIRLWDSMLSDHNRFDFLIHICCAMLRLVKGSILSGDFSSNMKILQNYPIYDVGRILNEAVIIQNELQ